MCSAPARTPSGLPMLRQLLERHFRTTEADEIDRRQPTGHMIGRHPMSLADAGTRLAANPTNIAIAEFSYARELIRIATGCQAPTARS